MLDLQMNDVTKILRQAELGDIEAAEQLLPLVYSELRKLAAAKLAREQAGQTLQATALVHEAYLRLVNVENPQEWNGRGHFFGAAAEAMRRIIVERVRKKSRLKHGGQVSRIDLDEHTFGSQDRNEEIVAIDEVLEQLEHHDQQAALLVKLRYFVGMEHQEAAQVLGISRRAADRLWLLARTWLTRALRDPNGRRQP